MSQLLARRYKGKIDAEADQLIQSVTDGMRRLNELVDDLLAYSRLSWRGDEAPAEFSLGASAEMALANMEELLRVSGGSVEIDPLPVVIGRRTHFVQLFQNLIGNSLKYRGDRTPNVRVCSEQTPGECIIHVADNGIGFDPAYGLQIFEPFKRLHGYEYAGSGIGLAICSRIVKQYGGRIWAESVPGEGSTFSFSIPVASCHPIGNRVAPASPPSA
jgi:light-regulated signal transduction histidine kinase (bacteriophytochrome)